MHGAIFDTNKSYWVIFSKQDLPNTPTIRFGDRKNLEPSDQAKWLGITLDKGLTFKRHRQNVIAKGKQRASFLASLAHQEWGIPPNLLRTMITATVHSAVDYTLPAWMAFDQEEYFLKDLQVIDLTCARAALGALRTTPAMFLYHDLNLPTPKTRTRAKLMSFVARALNKPDHHPLYEVVQQAQNSNPKAHHNIFHRFFQHDLGRQFEEHATQLPPDDNSNPPQQLYSHTPAVHCAGDHRH